MAQYPFNCRTCSKIEYSEKLTVAPECCGSPMSPMASICLLIPCPEGQTPVHTSVVGELVSKPSKWIIACGKTSLPPHFTDYPPACTCKECRDYAQKIYAEAGWDINEEGDLQDTDISVQLQDENPPPNPFK